MRPLLALLLMAAAGLPAAVPLSEYRQRRVELRKALPNSIVILPGFTERDHDDLRNGFFQEPNFYYLTGWAEPSAILVMTSTSDILFVPKRNPEKEKWTGRKLAASDESVRTVTGFEKVLPLESFEKEMPAILEDSGPVYLLTDGPGTSKLQPMLGLREVSNAGPPIARLRMKKSAAELELLQHSADVTLDAHRASWKRLTAGTHEYELAAVLGGVYFGQGCERHAYAPIVGSGPNGTVLHYAKNSRRMDQGELVVMDAGAECAMYAADVTRTVPVGGKFSKRQRELYDIVLGAQKAVIAAVKPGMMLSKTAPNSLHKIALDYLNAHGADLHGKPLGAYFTHGIGHHVGLDVHDAWDPAMPLAEGMVITVEPGLYIPEEQIGIRIEDMVLVTADGCKLLTGKLPREASELERTIAGK